MDWKWLDTAYQHDDEPTGGGNGQEPIPEAEPAAEPEGDLDSDLSADPEPAPEPTPEPEPEPPPAVERPKSFDDIFSPPQPAATPTHVPEPTHQPPPAQPEAPPMVEFPSEDDWINDPGAAARQLQKAMAYQNHQAQAPLHQTISDLRGQIGAIQHGSFEQISRRVHESINATDAAVDKMYAEDGPLNADPEFRNNSEIQEGVKGLIEACLATALEEADRTGNTRRLENIANDPKFARVALQMVKAKHEDTAPAPGLRPAASPVGPQPPTPSPGDGLTDQERESLKAARADGASITAKEMIAARKIKKEVVW